jgi:hypothetical protein
MYGQPWGPYTYLKLIGFVCVIVATLIYDEDIKLPCLFNYPAKQEQTVKEDVVSEETAVEAK